MTPDWTPLDSELAIWAREGRNLPVWWRDDDATAAVPKLDRLLALSDTVGLPVHLAVIPANAEPSLAERLNGTSAIPLVHGWAHVNHAPAGEKKAEFGDHRPLTDRLGDAARGLARLREIFGPTLAPVFVPPWNRIGSDLASGLADAGFRAISTFLPREAAEAAPWLLRVNTHLDPINWRGDRSLADPAKLIAQIAAQLSARRQARADNTEPYGLLTHHLVHDTAIWDFTAALLTRLMDGPVKVWTAATLQEDTPA